MYDEGALAKTGVGALTIAGVSLTLDWLLGLAIALILLGAVSYRIVTRNRADG
ncbi:hypothetical protein [Streptomyces cylindrosporus]|uniref:Peptidase n=1 Tax=Streptomyces cylindrosporus TaxID=2927583 RepID=A0ABS9YM37_9ACTN|nr:hypothetical protein [Streptomyces cylindrosporus]MCI3277615.1 hypothetical protein [Streptomyces cylindrosporus]